MRSARLVLPVVTAFVAGAVGFAYAQTTASTDGMIYACVSSGSAVPRIVSEPGQCKKSETELSWNQQGQPGQPGTDTAVWLTSRPLNTAVPVPITPPGTPSQPDPLFSLTLPDPPDGGGYLLAATFSFRNTGTVDADLMCNLGNVMAHPFFVPVSDQTAGQESLGGVYGSDTRTYSLTGVYDGGGLVGLHCGIFAWTTQGQPEPRIPSVVLNGAVFTAQRIDQLTVQAS